MLLSKICATLMPMESAITHLVEDQALRLCWIYLQVVQQFGIPHLFNLPIRPTLSAFGDSGMPEVVADPLGEVAKTFRDLGVCVVQQCAKIRQQVSTAVTHDKVLKAIKAKVPDSDEEFFLHPTTVRRNDRSAQLWMSGQGSKNCSIPMFRKTSNQKRFSQWETRPCP